MFSALAAAVSSEPAQRTKNEQGDACKSPCTYHTHGYGGAGDLCVNVDVALRGTVASNVRVVLQNIKAAEQGGTPSSDSELSGYGGLAEGATVTAGDRIRAHKDVRKVGGPRSWCRVKCTRAPLALRSSLCARMRSPAVTVAPSASPS